MPYCNLCKRKLNVDNDPTTRDCGGNDCILCMIKQEVDVGDNITALKLVNQLFIDIIDLEMHNASSK